MNDREKAGPASRRPARPSDEDSPLVKAAAAAINQYVRARIEEAERLRPLRAAVLAELAGGAASRRRDVDAARGSADLL